MLNPSDVYVSGGSSDLLVCWTDKVTKYDASSFYNWEQDNLPLHDLDERTHLLWERVGHPTSSITGMSFIVSAGAAEGCSPFYFATLSSCMAALPDVINYPILVEVLSFGDLGSLEIPSKTFGPRGALEIINRNSSFAPAIGLSGGPMSVVNYRSDYDPYSIASSVVPAGLLQEEIFTDGVSGPTLAFDMWRARSFTSDIYTASTTSKYDDPRFNQYPSYVFTRRVYADGDNRMTAGLRSAKNPWNTAASDFKDASGFEFDAYDAPAATRSTNESSMDTYDVSTLNPLNNTELNWGDSTSANNTISYGAAAFAYFNNLSNIKVHNCNGPIYIRNFNVDCQHVFDRGIEVLNSNVFLERCSVSRANKAGLYSDNSNVTLLRGFVGYRNYELVGSTRTGVPFREKIVSPKPQDSYGAGIYAINSTVNVSSTYARDVAKSVQASSDAPRVYPDYSNDIPIPTMEELYCLSRNDIGIHAVNSQIIGGRTELNGSGVNKWTDANQIFSELNTESGVKLENSKLEHSGRVCLYGNYKGLDSNTSEIITDVLKCKGNQAEALLLENSRFVYGKDLYQHYTYANQFGGSGKAKDSRFDQVGLIANGTHLKAINSTVAAMSTSSVPLLFNQFFTSGAFSRDNSMSGANSLLNGLVPSVIGTRNSDLELVHFVGNRRGDHSNDAGYDRPVYGSIIKVDKNSSVVARGSSKYANVLVGADGREKHIRHAGVFCNENSTASFQGPTVIASLGVDVLADNNSKMEFTPHRNEDGSLLVSSYLLDDPYNHTTVELHSTRACLVAKGNSEIVMQDLGDYQEFFGRKDESRGIVHGQAIPVDKFDYLNNIDESVNDGIYRNSVSAGYIQFYPNAYIDSAITDHGRDLNSSYDGGAYSDLFEKAAFDKYGTEVISGVFNSYVTTLTAPTYDPIDKVSTGGMCVRALEGSKVNVTNVHFPCGWHNTSGQVYDLSGNIPNCTRLRIWNIADDSVVNASYVSVSGLHPADSGYHGPSGSWDIRANETGPAPSSTPDTSSIAILDLYGKSNDLVESQIPGGAEFENKGSFRLFFSIDPAANWLVASSLDSSGYPAQIFSQGYQFSGNALANNTAQFNASSEFFSLLKFRDQNNLSGSYDPSGYYYASEMVYNPQTIKASLDESASNLFANAKHNSVGKSKLAKVVSIYYPYVEYPVGGDSYAEASVKTARGIASVNNFDLEKSN